MYLQNHAKYWLEMESMENEETDRVNSPFSHPENSSNWYEGKYWLRPRPKSHVTFFKWLINI